MSGIAEADLDAWELIACRLSLNEPVTQPLLRELATGVLRLIAERRARDALDEPPSPQAG